MKEITKLIKTGNIKLGYHSEKQTDFIIRCLFDNNIVNSTDRLYNSYTNIVVDKIYKKGLNK